MIARRLRFFCLALAAPLLFGAAKTPVPKPRPKVHAHVRPAPPAPPPEPLQDLSHAIPTKDAIKLPSTKEQFNALKDQIVHDRPAMLDAKQKSDALKAQAIDLQRRLISTAARVVDLETEKVTLDADIARLAAEDAKLSADFARDRVSVGKLLAILERMQHDMPPAIVLRADDTLSAARSAMLIGASVPNVYQAAASLARRIGALERTRSQLIERRAESIRNTIRLRAARQELDQLLATKQLEADAAASRYGDLAAKLEKAATTATDLQALLTKVAQLRGEPDQKNVVVVTASKSGAPGALQAHSC